NKGSTDQHAYLQQLREGANNFFITFIKVLRDRGGPSQSDGRTIPHSARTGVRRDAFRIPHSAEVEPGVTSGDYLHGLLQGTSPAWRAERRRPSRRSSSRAGSFVPSAKPGVP